MKANSADEVEELPIKRSLFEFMGESAPCKLCQNELSGIPLEYIVPEQERFPVAPSTVHPVALAPPARLMEVAVEEPGPMFIVPAAPARFRVPVRPVLNSARVPVVTGVFIVGF